MYSSQVESKVETLAKAFLAERAAIHLQADKNSDLKTTIFSLVLLILQLGMTVSMNVCFRSFILVQSLILYMTEFLWNMYANSVIFCSVVISYFSCYFRFHFFLD